MLHTSQVGGLDLQIPRLPSCRSMLPSRAAPQPLHCWDEERTSLLFSLGSSPIWVVILAQHLQREDSKQTFICVLISTGTPNSKGVGSSFAMPLGGDVSRERGPLQPSYRHSHARSGMEDSLPTPKTATIGCFCRGHTLACASICTGSTPSTGLSRGLNPAAHERGGKA